MSAASTVDSVVAASASGAKPSTVWLAIALPFEYGVQQIMVSRDASVATVVDLVLQRGKLPATLSGADCRLCVYTTPTDRRQLVLLEPGRAIGDYDIVCAHNQHSRPARAALMRHERIVNQWDARLVARCIGNTAAWFADTAAAGAFIAQLGQWVPSLLGAISASRSSSAPPEDDFRVSQRDPRQLLRRASSFSMQPGPAERSAADSGANNALVLRRMRSDIGIASFAASRAAPIRIVIACVGITIAASCVDEWSRKGSLCIAIGARYGAIELSPPARSEPFAAAAQLGAKHTLDIGLLLSEAPLETHVLVRLCALDAAGALDTLAWCVVPLYDDGATLVSGTVRARLWPAATAGRPLAMATSNANPFCDTASVHLEFDVPRSRRWTPTIAPMNEERANARDGAPQVVRDVLSSLGARAPTIALTASERAYVWQHRHTMTIDAGALALLAGAVPLDVASTRLASLADLHRAVLDCPPAAEPTRCLRLLGPEVTDSHVRAFAVEQLARVDDELLMLLLPQLMQALKCELHLDSPLARLVLTRASQTTAIGQRLFFLSQCELSSASIAPRIGVLLEAYLRSDWKARVTLERLQELSTSLAQMVLEMRGTRRNDRTELVHSRLRAVSRRVLGRPLVSPLNAQHLWGRLIVERCKVMQSKKTPLWLEFEACEAQRGARTRHVVIFKCGDDLRQDMLALQVVRVLERAWQVAALGIEMTPYACTATAIDCGFIEAVSPATTMASISAQYGGASAALRATPLRKWFVTNARAQHVPLDEVVTRFASSCAGYSVATYVLGVADRHNDNVMVRPSGHVFHIDYGHILGNYKTKFGFKRETAPFVLTKDFVNVIGEGEPFERFVALGAAAFAVARATAPLLFDLLRLMVPAQLPELRSIDAIQHMVQALRLDLSQLDAIDHWRALTLDAQSTRRTALNNMLHIALGADRSDKHDERTARTALAAIDDAHDGSTTSVVVRSAKEKRSALELLLTRAIAAVGERGVALESVELINLGKWNNECADLLHRLLRVSVERLDLRRSPVRDSLARIFTDRAPHLVDLDLSGCALGNAALPSLWHAVPRLARLALVDCKLTNAATPMLGELLAKAMALEELDVSENKLADECVQQIGDTVQRISTMRVLRSGVERVDSAVHERGLVAERNFARSLASLIDTLRRERRATLDLSNAVCMRTLLSSVTIGRVNWSHVTTLSLAHIRLASLTQLVPAIATARALAVLSLRDNQLVELSRALMSALVELPLVELDVSHNRLTMLPVTFGRLSKLAWLNARGNALTSLPPLASGAPLHYLDLSQNEFAEWPATLDAATLAQCRQLLLADNKLTAVPSLMLATLGELTYLSLRGNWIARLPDGVPDLRDAALVAASTRELVKHSSPASCVRVMLLGKESSGKSTLVRVLLNSKAKLGRDVSTDGINVTPWQVSSTQTLMLYDFGGQAVFYPTHAFFLSKRVVSLIVVNLADMDFANVNYWLQQVSQIGRPHRVIVVGTHVDQLGSAPDAAERKLTELHEKVLYRFPDLIECHCVVSAVARPGARTGIEIVREAVLEAATAMARTHAEQACERALRAKLAALRASGVRKLKWSEYAALAAALAITHDALLDVTRSLHCSGDLLWFETAALRHTVILDAQFVADALRTVVTFRHSFVHDGAVSDADLRAALPPSLTVSELNEVTSLLERFDVLCRLPKAQAALTWLVPCLLPAARSLARELSLGELRRTWTRIWRFAATPPAWFMPRIVTRALHMSNDVEALSLWANGAALRCAAGCLAPTTLDERNDVFVDVLFEATPRPTVRVQLRVHALAAPPAPTAGSALAVTTTSARRPPTPQVLLLRVVHFVEQVIDQCDTVRAMMSRDVLCNCAACGKAEATATRFEQSTCEMVANRVSGCELRCGAQTIDVIDVAPDLALFNVFDELIGVDELNLREEIGRGAFGRVYRGYWRGRRCAVKQLGGEEEEESVFSSTWSEFSNEAHIMSSLEHPCIVRLLAVAARPPTLVTEYCVGGNLGQFVADRPVSAVSNELRRRIAIDMARALEYLHSRSPPVLHRDVRPPNVLLTYADDASLKAASVRGSVVVKLTDFGLATHLPAARDSLESWIWMAPETRGQLALYSDRADMFSYAMVLYCLMTHEMPFADVLEVRDAWRVERDVIEHNLRPQLAAATTGLYATLRNLIVACWAALPEQRPAASEVVTALAAEDDLHASQQLQLNASMRRWSAVARTSGGKG